MSEYIRSPLVRTLYAKLEHQQSHANNKHQDWYVIRERYLNPAILEAFVQSFQDEETETFLSNCFMKSDWIFTHFYHAIAKALLTWFMSATSVNGLLGRGSMFVLSSAQFAKLLNIPMDCKFNTLLDLGAGDGLVTSKLAPFFHDVYVTELSGPMRRRLVERGFKLLDPDQWSCTNHYPQTHYDVVSCLNLLDRCDRPLTMLRQIASVLKPQTGRLLLALVLPLKQYVETSPDHKPLETLDVAHSDIWENQLDDLVRHVFEPIGFVLEKWTRLPYLCEGDFSQSFYYLNDVVFVLRVQSTAPG